MHALLFWLLWNPLLVFLVLLGLAIGNLWRKRRETRLRLLAVTLPYLLLVVLSIPACVYFFRGLLEWQYPPLRDRPEDVEAIVVLASAVHADTDAPSGFVLDVHSRSRCQCAAAMFRKGKPCPVLVSGAVHSRMNLPVRRSCATILSSWACRPRTSSSRNSPATPART
jgi:hypothetical protein